MDIGRAFSFVFEDEEWMKKIGIGGLIFLIPIAGWLAIAGYMAEVTRNVIKGDPTPLPDWSDFGAKLMEGLYLMLIGFVYSLIVLIPTIIYVVIVAVVGGAANNDAVGLVSCCFMPIIGLLGLAMSIIVWPAYGRYIQTNNLGSAFQVGEIIAMVRSSLKPWLMLWLVSLLASIVGSLGVACVITYIFTMMYAAAIMGHALAQTLLQVGGARDAGEPTVDIRV